MKPSELKEGQEVRIDYKEASILFAFDYGLYQVFLPAGENRELLIYQGHGSEAAKIVDEIFDTAMVSKKVQE